MSTITVSVKLMTGEILMIEHDPLVNEINDLRRAIQKADPLLPICCQKLILLDNGMYALFMEDTICFSFIEDNYSNIYPQEFSIGYYGCNTPRYEVYTLYLNDLYCSEFIYDTTRDQYASVDTCHVTERNDTAYDYHITPDTKWHSSLLMCIRSDIIPIQHPVMQELMVRFKKHRVLNQLLFIK